MLLIANSVLKFTSLHHHGNKGCSGIRLNDSVHCCHRKLPIWCENMGLILNMSRVIVQIFITIVTGAGVTQISLTQLHWPTHKTLLWCKNCRCISITSWVTANFPLKFTNFCYHGNKGQSGRRLNAQHNWPNPKIPCLVQKSGTYVKYKLCYGKFSVKISKSSLPWQQGLVWHKFLFHSYCCPLNECHKY